jgi:5-formyltetrahydrofolate cyclo-ligase
VSRGAPDKDAVRRAVWDRLEAEGIARFPYPPHGRIPNFAGAREAAERAMTCPLLAEARCVKINPDAPQRPLRRLLLEAGVVLLMPTPRLRGGFLRLDPRRIPAGERAKAASLSHAKRFATSVPLERLPQVDAVVTGSVAVTEDGRRCGKGHGYSDLEVAILRELGHAPVPILTTVHEAQIVDAIPRDSTDLPLAFVVTPERVVRVRRPPPAPDGIAWERLDEADLEAMPVLAELRARRGGRS